MIKKLRKITSLVTMVAILFSYTITPAIAVTKLSPRHLYYWAQTKNYSRLNQFKRYINLQNEDNKTALCLAQEAKDRNSYATLLKFGASTDVDCHDDDDPICAVIVDKRNKISPAWLLLGAGAIGAAYILSDDGGSSDKSEPTLCDASFNFKDTCPNGMTETGRCEDINGTHLKCEPIDCSQYTEATCAYTGIKIDKECTTNNAEGTNEVTTYQCACADGWNPGSCPIGKTCDTVTTPVECYTNERCPDDYSLTTKDNEDIFSYSQSAEGTGCYKITGCNTANGWQQGTCNPSYTSCQQEEQNGIQCYKVNACDRSSYPFDTCNAGTISTASCADTSGTYHQCACDNGNGYYSEDLGLTQCGQGGENGWEWANTQTPSQNGTTLTCSTCKAKECNDKNYNPQTGQCTLHDNLKATQGSNDGWSGNNQCFTCIYECATGLYQDEDSCNQATQNGEYCIKVDNDLNIACYDTTSCPTEYPNTFTSKEVCEQGGYTCQQSPSVPGCFKRDVLACTQGSTDITNSYCATTNGGSENSWTLKDTGYVSGGKKCYECDAVNDCATGTSSDYINATSCPTQNYKKATSSPINGKYNGSAQCYECSYTCDESQNAYSNEDNCKTDNTGCTYDTTSQCWIIGTSCPNGQDLSPTDLTICGTYPTYVTAFKAQSGATSGEDACYKCSYTCNTSMAGIYNDQTSCENNTQNEKAYSCTKDETYGCYQRGEPLSCTQGVTTCEPAKEGFTLSDEENGYYTGETPCLTCTYSCNGSTHVTAENKKEGLDYTEVTEHGVTCYYAPVCPTTHPNTYASKEDCEEGGYSCIESATGSGCFSRTAKTCDEVTKGSVLKCTDYDGYTTTPTKAGLAGGEQCYTCSYSCDEETYFSSNNNSMFEYEDIYDGPAACYKPTSCATGYTEATDTNPSCPTGNAYQSSISKSTLRNITCYNCSYSCKAGWTDTEPSPGTPYIAENIPGSEDACYQEIACNEGDYKYSSQEACEQNGLFTCEQENEYGCWIATDCGSQTSTSTCSGNNNAFTIQTSTHHGYNTTCYSCAYECNTTNGYKPNSQLNSTTQCGTYGDNVYKLDTQTITASDNTLITCNKCVVDNCSDTGFEVGGCSDNYDALQYINGYSIGKMANGDECFKCEYECKNDYYEDENLCFSDAEAEGKTCSATEELSITCWAISECDTSKYNFTSCPEGMQEEDKCTDNNGTYLKCKPNDCSQYTEANCNTEGITIKDSCTTNNTEGTSPTTTYQCACADDWTLGSCPAGNTCTEITNHGLTCYKDATCDTSKGYYTQEECPLNTSGKEGYDCTPDATSGCYTRTEKTCPDGYTIADDITEEEEWTSLTSQYTSGYSGNNRCYRYELGCYEAKNAFSSCPTGYTCEEKTTTATSINTGATVSNELTCYFPTACDTSNNYYETIEETGFTYTTMYKNNIYCYKIIGCNNGYGYYKESEKTASIIYKEVEHRGYTCYKEYTCNNTIGEYATQKTCSQNGVFDCQQADDTDCYIATGCTQEYNYSMCPTDTFTSHNLVQTTYTSTNNITCYSQCTTTCDTTANWRDDYTSTLECNGGNYLGDNGYYFQESTVLDLTCKRCQAYNCGVEGSVVDACPEIEWLNNTNQSSTGNVAVDSMESKECYTCGYECDTQNSYYSDKDECISENSQAECIEQKITISGTEYICYGPTITQTLINNNLTTIKNTSLIEKTSTGTEDVYGLSSDSDIKNTTNTETGDVGQIKITHNSTGKAYGMYGSSSNHLLNDEGASINIANNSTGTAVGMYASRGGTAINKGDITITGTTGTAVGILGEGENYIANLGSINVEGQDAYGIRVLDGTNTTIINEGSITVNGQNEAYGIYVDQNASADTVTNIGTITVNGNQNDTSRAIVLNGAKLRNAGLMSVAGELNLNSLGASKVYLEDGATYEAKSISGELTAGTSTVMDNNLDTYIKKNAIISDNTDKLNIKSESALFDAKTKTNSDGNVDVVLERKEFSEFTPNNSISDYLTQNYQAKNFENAFNSLKSATTTMAVKNYLADFMGYDKLLNFADENFNVLRSLNRTMADTILKPTDEPYRVVAGYDNFNLETDDKGMLSGYDLNAHSMFTFGDKRLNNWSRLGLGISFTDMNTSYEKGGSRDLNMVSIFMPYLRKFSDKLNLVTILNLGYGYGDYERGADRESDLEEIIYGLTNELRYNINLNGFAELEPALMLNAIGYTEDGFNEKDAENAIKTKRTNNLSVELGAGLFVKKEVKMEKYGKLGFKIGGVYYHEFADPYRDITVRHKNGIGPWYNINDYANLYQRDRAVLEAVIDYAYKDLSLYLKYNKLIQKNNPDLFDMGIKYNF